MRSCGIVAMALMLAAQEMGYASCPMVGFDFDKVGKAYQLACRSCCSYVCDHWKGGQGCMGSRWENSHE